MTNLTPEQESAYQEIADNLPTGATSKNPPKTLKCEPDNKERLKTALKPCPFCGDTSPHLEGVPTRGGDTNSHYIRCDNCGTEGPQSFEFNAGELWNTRHEAKASEVGDGLSDAMNEPWNKFYQMSYHSGLTTRDIFTHGFEAAYLKLNIVGIKDAFQRIKDLMEAQTQYSKLYDDIHAIARSQLSKIEDAAAKPPHQSHEAPAISGASSSPNLSANWHIRYSVKTTALFSSIAEPRQHAVHNDTLKTFCGRDASQYWKLDESAQDEKHVNCTKCRDALAKITPI